MPVADSLLRAALAPGGTLDALPAELDVLGHRYSGKVRENFTKDGLRTIVVTDRVSAFDRVLGTIPFKGQVLNQLSAWWFQRTRELVANHMLAVPDPNTMVVRDAEPLPVEVIVRGYLTGVTATSLWTMYAAGVERPYGLDLPAGMHKDDRLPRPVLTPTTKAAAGQHDAPLSSAEVVARGLVPEALWRKVEAVALALFAEGQRVAEAAGLLLVDTKYELGLVDGRLVLIDEVHTPDSSRYWLASAWQARTPDRPPEHLDKELLRKELAAIGYRGDGAPPPLSDAIRKRLSARYIELFERLTGESFAPAAGGRDRIERALSRPLVPILMGSRSDLEHGMKVKNALAELGVASELRVASAHKSPGLLLEVLDGYESDPRPKVYIAIAGRSNALSGMLCAAVSAPVVSCPPYSDRFGGADVFSSLRMPSHVAPALVLDPENAAFFCAKVLSLMAADVRWKVAAVQQASRDKLRHDDAELVSRRD
jgi:phosphoribosylaminoimidazole-succinocarboxamide synthase